MLLMLGALLGPSPAFAQIPDLGDKAEQLIAEARERGEQLRPLYQDQDDVAVKPIIMHRGRKPQGNRPASAPRREPGRAHGAPPNAASP
jgi:hypothetical protein